MRRCRFSGFIETARHLTGEPIPSLEEWGWVSYIDIRRFAGFTLPNVHSISGMGTRRMLSRPGPVWFYRDLDRFHGAATYPDTVSAHESFTRYLERVRTVVRSVALTGDYMAPTPALPLSL